MERMYLSRRIDYQVKTEVLQNTSDFLYRLKYIVDFVKKGIDN